MEKLFVYGILTDENVQRHILGYIPKQEKGILAGFKLKEQAILGRFSNLEKDEDSFVSGIVLDLNPEDLDKTDTLENVNQGLYDRHIVGNYWVYYK